MPLDPNDRKILCPTCKEHKMDKRSKRCRYCSIVMFANSTTGAEKTKRSMSGHISTGKEIDLIRPINPRYYSPRYRPAHYPPPCEACNGFGYIGGTKCQSCILHPGHAMSHERWTAIGIELVLSGR